MGRVRLRLGAWAAAFTLAAAGAGSAMADGYASTSVKDAPLPAESYVWDGLHVGVGIGLGSFEHDGHLAGRDCFKKLPALVNDACDDKFRFGNDDWDVFGTVQLGYDRVVHNRLLIGVFSDFDFYHDAKSAFAVAGDGADIKVELELENVWHVGGRLGVLVTPRILLYGVGGYSRANLDGRISDGLGASFKLSDDVDGYFVGGGGEIKLRSNVALRLEYRWTDFGSLSATQGDAVAPLALACLAACPPDKLKTDVDGDSHSVRAALVFKFGGPEAVVPAPLK